MSDERHDDGRGWAGAPKLANDTPAAHLGETASGRHAGGADRAHSLNTVWP